MDGKIRFDSLNDLYEFVKTVNLGKFKLSFSDIVYLVNFDDPKHIKMMGAILRYPGLANYDHIFKRLLELYEGDGEESISGSESGDYGRRSDYRILIEILLQRYLDGEIELVLYRIFEVVFYIVTSKSTQIIDAVIKAVNNHEYEIVYKGDKVAPRSKAVQKQTRIIFNPVKDLYEMAEHNFNYTRIAYEIMDRIDTPHFIKYLTKEEQNSNFIKGWTADKVIDISMALRGTGLPSLAIENITSHLYNTDAFTAFELMSLITPIIEHKPHIIRAGETVYDEQEYIDV